MPNPEYAATFFDGVDDVPVPPLLGAGRVGGDRREHLELADVLLARPKAGDNLVRHPGRGVPPLVLGVLGVVNRDPHHAGRRPSAVVHRVGVHDHRPPLLALLSEEELAPGNAGSSSTKNLRASLTQFGGGGSSSCLLLLRCCHSRRAESGARPTPTSPGASRVLHLAAEVNAHP